MKMEKLEHGKVAKEPSFKQRCCPDPRTDDQLQRDVSSKQKCCPEPGIPDQLDRGVSSKCRTGWVVAGGGLKGGAPGSGSNDSVSILIKFVSLHQTILFRCLFRTRSLLTRRRLKKKSSPPRAILESSWKETSPPRTQMSLPSAGLAGWRCMEVWRSGGLAFREVEHQFLAQRTQ